MMLDHQVSNSSPREEIEKLKLLLAEKSRNLRDRDQFMRMNHVFWKNHYSELKKVPNKIENRMTPDEWKTRCKSRLQTFKDIHKGQRCFIIGNGPSLNQTDLALLEKEFTFGVNGLFYKNKDIGFKPTYYVVEDNHVVADNIDEINQVDYSIRFFPEKYKEQIHPTDQTFFLPVDWGFYFKNHPYYEKPRFSEDCSEVLYVGQTVTYLNLQLAFYMGFSEVYLIGVDFSYSVPPSSTIEGLTIISQEDDPNHFHPDYFGKGKKWHDPKLHNCLKAYQKAREVYTNAGRLVANATVGGHLEALERKDFYSLFSKPVKLQKPNEASIYFFRKLANLRKEFGCIYVDAEEGERADFRSVLNEDSASRELVTALEELNGRKVGFAYLNTENNENVQSAYHGLKASLGEAPLLLKFSLVKERFESPLGDFGSLLVDLLSSSFDVWSRGKVCLAGKKLDFDFLGELRISKTRDRGQVFDATSFFLHHLIQFGEKRKALYRIENFGLGLKATKFDVREIESSDDWSLFSLLIEKSIPFVIRDSNLFVQW